jgi:hypothetical protein
MYISSPVLKRIRTTTKQLSGQRQVMADSTPPAPDMTTNPYAPQEPAELLFLEHCDFAGIHISEIFFGERQIFHNDALLLSKLYQASALSYSSDA